LFSTLVLLHSPTTAQQCRSETEKNILEDLFSSVLSQSKKYHPSRNLKFNYLGLFQRSKLRISMEKFLLISLELNFTPNTLGSYGLIKDPRHTVILNALLRNHSACLDTTCVTVASGFASSLNLVRLRASWRAPLGFAKGGTQ